MSFILPERARVVRRIAVAPGAFTFDDVEEDWFPSHLGLRNEGDYPEIEEDDSPRSSLPSYRLRYAMPPISPSGAAPRFVGERVETLGETYELLRRPRELRSGRRAVGVQCSVLPVTALYPFTADLVEGKDDDVVQADVMFSMWGTTESTAQRSAWEDSEAEAPLDFVDELKANRFLLVGGQRFHIVRSYVPPNAPRVRMILRKKDHLG